jgi:hypothetical protein
MAVRACVCAPLVHFLQTGSRTVCAPTTAPDCSQDGVERQAKRQGLRGGSLTRSLATVPLHSGRRSILIRTVYFRSTSLSLARAQRCSLSSQGTPLRVLYTQNPCTIILPMPTLIASYNPQMLFSHGMRATPSHPNPHSLQCTTRSGTSQGSSKMTPYL